MTSEETGQLLRMLSGMYPNLGNKVDRDTVAGYHMMLRDVPMETLMDAMPAILAKHPTFPPTAPELRNAVLAAVTDLPSAALAWEQVMAMVRDRGMWRGIDLDADPTLVRAIKAVGWEQICTCDRDKLGFERDAFLEIYGAMRSAALEHASYQGIGVGQSVDMLEAAQS